MATAKAASGRKPNVKQRRFRALKLVVAYGCLLGLVAATAGGVYFAGKLREANAMIPTLPAVMEELSLQPSVIVAADGTELYRVTNEYRKPVEYDNIPQLVIDATLAAEDKRFFQHSGIDYMSLAGMLMESAGEGRVTRGASTLTMQIAKRVYTSPVKSMDRKVQDMALAVVIERQLAKWQILELYLNQVYYGEGAYGIQAAADVYFGKALDELTLGEAALLARCVRRPSRENPFVNEDKARENRDLVLAIMLDEQMITRDEYEAALRETITLRKRAFGSGARRLAAPYFVDAVLDELSKEGIDISEGGYRVETALNPKMQALAEKQVVETVKANKNLRVATGAFLVINRRGEILAMVGGVDYDRNQYNMTTQGRRQPGSSFKPFVYATAFETGAWSPTKGVSNARLTYPPAFPGAKPWTVHNSSEKYGGHVSIRTAFAFSYNVCAVRVMEATGASRVASFAATNFGFESKLDPVLPLALGATAVSPLEMARGYSVFMLGGDRVEPRLITRVIGPDKEVLRSFQPEYTRNVLSAGVAEQMDYLMRSVVTSGTGTAAKSVANARGKTGTTSDNRDAWFCGYTDELLGIGWVANEQREGDRWLYPPMHPRAFGGTVTVKMWAPIMAGCQKILGEESREFETPRWSGGWDDEPADVRPPENDVIEPPDEEPPVREEDLIQPPVTPPLTPPATGETRPATEPRNESEYVYVEVCAESGRQAGFYCSPTLRKRFLASEAPTTVCRLHGPGRSGG